MFATIPIRLLSRQEEQTFLLQMREIYTGNEKHEHKGKEARADEHG
jgi:hypothetical protein